MFRRRAPQAAFTLVEVMVATVITTMVLVASLTALQFHRIESRRALDQKIMLQFLEKYLEFARARPINEIAVGQPLNPLFDGTGAMPLPDGTTANMNIRFPPANTWVNLNTANYINFHPELAAFANRQPQFQCNITSQNGAGGALRSRAIAVSVRWRSPFNINQWMTLAASTLVYSDIS